MDFAYFFWTLSYKTFMFSSLLSKITLPKPQHFHHIYLVTADMHSWCYLPLLQNKEDKLVNIFVPKKFNHTGLHLQVSDKKQHLYQLCHLLTTITPFLNTLVNFFLVPFHRGENKQATEEIHSFFSFPVSNLYKWHEHMPKLCCNVCLLIKVWLLQIMTFAALFWILIFRSFIIIW